MINIISDFSFKFNSSVKFNFDGGDLTSDSGGLLIEELKGSSYEYSNSSCGL